MVRTSIRRAAPLAMALLLLGASAALAVNVPAGGGPVSLPGSISAVNLDLAGPIIEDDQRPFNAFGVKGHLQDRVVRSNTTGLLYFYYRIVVEPGSSGRVIAVRKHGFGPAVHTIDADWRIDGLGTGAPATAQRTADGAWVGFNHNGLAHAIGPGQSSRFVYIGAGTTQYKLGGITHIVIQGKGSSGTVRLRTFSPIH